VDKILHDCYIVVYFVIVYKHRSGRAAQGVGLQTLTCWNCGFESRQVYGCLSLVNVVCCQVEVSATGRSLVQRSPNECGVSEYDIEASTMRLRPTMTVEPWKKY
jgi:hypothetical protein